MDRWPYPEDDEPPRTQPPSWHCPEGLCECNPTDHLEAARFAVLLCNERGERMSGARYRIRRGSEVLSDAHADGDGWAIVELPHPKQMVRIEWAPGTTPLSRRYPFRQQYVVDAAAHPPARANLHRLHNLGFHSWTHTARNVRSFKQRYGILTPDEDLASIENSVTLFHDEALVPAVSERGEVFPPLAPKPPPLRPAGVLQPPPPAVFLTLVDSSSNPLGRMRFVLRTDEREDGGTTDRDGCLPFDIYHLDQHSNVTLFVDTENAGEKELDVQLPAPERPGRHTLWLQSWYP